jgi:phosphoribosylformylglycinamidine (FGAM) synthase PurS component
LSVAVKEEMATVREVAVAGNVKAVTFGGVVSVKVMRVLALTLDETLPAASLAQA